MTSNATTLPCDLRAIERQHCAGLHLDFVAENFEAAIESPRLLATLALHQPEHVLRYVFGAGARAQAMHPMNLTSLNAWCSNATTQMFASGRATS